MKKRSLKILSLFIAALTLLSLMSISASAATVTKTKEYTIKGLQNGNAVQKAVIYGSYVYTIQHSGTNSWLTKCKIDEDTKTATRVGDRMVLQNFGHAQSLEPFSYNGKTYFWVNCKNNPNDTDWNWGIQVARIEFKAGETVNYTSVPRLTFGSITRVEFALSSDANEILFWVKNGSSVTWSAYKTAAINKKLDEKAQESSHYINISNFTKIFSTTSCTGSSYRPNGSNQGLEFANYVPSNGTGRSIYICGGAAGDNLGIFKLVKSGSGYTLHKKIWLGTIGGEGEMEGLQIKGSKLYFSVTDKSKAKDSGRFVIYSIPKSAFD